MTRLKDLSDTFFRILKLYLDMVYEMSHHSNLLGPARQDNIPLEAGSNPFQAQLVQYQALAQKTEGMIIRHVTSEVERDLRRHLTR